MIKWDSFQGCKDFSVSTKSINVIHQHYQIERFKSAWDSHGGTMDRNKPANAGGMS